MQGECYEIWRVLKRNYAYRVAMLEGLRPEDNVEYIAYRLVKAGTMPYEKIPATTSKLDQFALDR